MLPKIQLDVRKDGQVIENIILEGKPLFTFGCNPNKSSVILLHASISRVHAALIIDEDKGVMLMDLMSKASTMVNQK